VVLSPSFLAKGWPKRELNALIALEESGHKVILPVWHEITKSALAEQSPILADRLAAETSSGISNVAVELLTAMLDPSSGSPSVVAPGLALRLNSLLAGVHEIGEVTAFLVAHPDIIRTAVGAGPDAFILWKSDFQSLGAAAKLLPDVAIGALWRTTGRRSWQFLIFCEPGTQTLTDEGEVSPRLTGALQAVAGWREWIRSNRRAAAARFTDIALDFPCTVVVGRRDGAGAGQKQRLAELIDSLAEARIRTYDWLVEAAAQLDERRTR
jgi:hypothetical protein